MLQDALKNFYFSQFGQICKLDNATPPSKKYLKWGIELNTNIHLDLSKVKKNVC